LKHLAIAFTGPSGSGKTTLIEKISNKLSKEFNIAIIKHDPSNKAKFDVPGKDSDRFFKSGANVAVVSNERTTIFKHESSNLDRLIEHLKPFDLLLVEGLKTWDLPRIGIFRGTIEESYIPHLQAVAIDSTIPQEQLNNLSAHKLNLNNTDEIIDYIWKNATQIKG
jgi:molybdopterin-guanine dinucleotide biosynthesis protein B